MGGGTSQAERERPALLTTAAVAEELSCSRAFVIVEQNTGRLPYVRLGVGGHRRVRRCDLDAYISNNLVQGATGEDRQ